MPKVKPEVKAKQYPFQMKTLNEYISQFHPGYEVVKAKWGTASYFYVDGPETEKWVSTVIDVSAICHLTYEQWESRVKALRNSNGDFC